MAAERPRVEIVQLVAEHHQAVYRYGFRLSGSAADAEDLTQQTFLVAQQKLHQLLDPDKARNWLFAMLRNNFLKARQRSRRLGPPEARLPLDSIPADPPGDEAIDREKLQQAINGLSPEFRAVLLMFYFEDLSYREIAEELEIPIGTVMSRLARAKQWLRGQLFEPDERKRPARPEPAVRR
jgi:RNA polymerase sigma-70 factor, ECF subfamily